MDAERALQPIEIKSFLSLLLIDQKGYNVIKAFEVVMFEKNDLSSERSELLEKANSLKAQFKNNEDARLHYATALEKICTKNSKTIQEFLMLAESSQEYNAEYAEALSLDRIIRSLSMIK